MQFMVVYVVVLIYRSPPVEHSLKLTSLPRDRDYTWCVPTMLFIQIFMHQVNVVNCVIFNDRSDVAAMYVGIRSIPY